MSFDELALRDFAFICLEAALYPNDLHRFHVCECRACGRSAFGLFLAHSPASDERGFRGEIRGRCFQCGDEVILGSFKQQGDTPVRLEQPKCACGDESFFTAVAERFEGSVELPENFDEGVVVGQCRRCGRPHDFAYTVSKSSGALDLCGVVGQNKYE